MEEMTTNEALRVIQGLRDALLRFAHEGYDAADDDHVENMKSAMAKLNDNELATVALVAADYFDHAEAVK